MEEVLDLPNENGTRKRKLAGEQLARLRYSVEVLIRDTVAIVLHRKRKGEAAIHRGQYACSGRLTLRELSGVGQDV